MAIIKAVSSHAPIGTAIDYVTRREKAIECLISGMGVCPETAKEEMEATKELYHKTGGRTYKHFVQSFAPGEPISPEEAHEIAVEFVQKCLCFRGYEVLLATHQDKEHLHTHFIVNSVSYRDGKKFQMSAKDLQAMKDLSDELCREHGLSITIKGQSYEGAERIGIVAWVKEKYQYLYSAIEEKTKSYVVETASIVKGAMREATSRDEFIKIMREQGYSVDWQDRHKHITFTDPDGHKVRDTNLNRTFNLGVSKAELEELFVQNASVSIEDSVSVQLHQAIAALYRSIEYENVRTEIDREIRQHQIALEVCAEKNNTADRAIRSLKEEIAQCKKALQGNPVLKKRERCDLQEKIEHGKILIESIQADRDRFLVQYGLSTTEEIRKCKKDIQVAETAFIQLQDRIEREKSEYSRVMDLIDQLREKNPEVHPVITDETMEELKAELREEFGDNFSEEKLAEAIMQAEKDMEKTGIISGREILPGVNIKIS